MSVLFQELLLVHGEHPDELLEVDEAVVVEVGEPDHQLDVLLKEALAVVEHAHSELLLGDLSVPISVKGSGVGGERLRN